jgi:hypothetical protein
MPAPTYLTASNPGELREKGQRHDVKMYHWWREVKPSEHVTALPAILAKMKRVVV